MFLAFAATLLLAAATPAAGGMPIPATMVTTVNSGTAKVGDPFTFRTTQSVEAGRVSIPAGTLGHGVVTAVSPAAGSHRGTLTLAPQYLQLPGRKRVTVVPGTSTSYAARRHLFPIPIPFPGFIIVGGEVNPGGDVTIGPGTNFDVVITPSAPQS